LVEQSKLKPNYKSSRSTSPLDFSRRVQKRTSCVNLRILTTQNTGGFMFETILEERNENSPIEQKGASFLLKRSQPFFWCYRTRNRYRYTSISIY